MYRRRNIWLGRGGLCVSNPNPYNNLHHLPALKLTARRILYIFLCVKGEISVRIRRNAAKNLPGMMMICLRETLPFGCVKLNCLSQILIIISMCLYRLHADAFWQFLEENSNLMNEDRFVWNDINILLVCRCYSNNLMFDG